MEDLNEPVFQLVEFAEAVLGAHLTTVPPETTAVWKKGRPRPAIPGMVNDDDP